MKKTLIALTLTFVMLAGCLIGCGMHSTDDSLKADAAAVFTLDVNPGVRIYVKADNSVIALEATNADGEEVVAELELNGTDYEAAVEEIIDKMEEKGYLEGEESSVLVSVEKKALDISEKINEKINKAFEKHGKRASVIEQELDKLDEKTGKIISEIAKKHNISEGKAHLIEKIREEFPELSEDELASLKVNDLRIMLEDTSDDIKNGFKKIGKVIEDAYVGRNAALDSALTSLEINIEDIKMQHVRVARDDGKMVYEVEFVYNETKYEITVDAESGSVLETESEEFKEFDVEGFIDDFCNQNNIDKDELKDNILNELFGKNESKEEQDGVHSEEKPLSRGELLENILTLLGISEDTLKKTDVKFHETEKGTACAVTVELENGDTYKLVVEAYSGAILRAELNGNTVDIPTEKTK